MSAPLVIAVANTGDLIERGTQLLSQKMARISSGQWKYRVLLQQFEPALAATSLGLATV
jgi:hypothetical protein